MSKEYTLADFTDIFDYSTGWFSDSSICSLFYQIFKRFPSMKMVKYKVNQDFLKEIKELYQQDDAFDIFEHVYCNHFENEKENGMQIWFSPNDDKSPILADSILNITKKFLQHDNKRFNKKSDSAYYLLHKADRKGQLSQKSESLFS